MQALAREDAVAMKVVDEFLPEIDLEMSARHFKTSILPPCLAAARAMRAAGFLAAQ